MTILSGSKIFGLGSLRNASWSNGFDHDRVLVTAAAPHVPAALTDQLSPEGRIIIPIGDIYEQRLMVYTKEGRRMRAKRGIGVRFVPLLGEDGFRR